MVGWEGDMCVLCGRMLPVRPGRWAAFLRWLNPPPPLCLGNDRDECHRIMLRNWEVGKETP